MIGRRLCIKISELEAQTSPDPAHGSFSSTIRKLYNLFRSGPIHNLEGFFTDVMDGGLDDMKDHFDDPRDSFVPGGAF